MLAFEVGQSCLDVIFERYSRLHPNLLPTEYKHGTVLYDKEAKMFEVFAYYQCEKSVSSADEGTRLRFLESVPGSRSKCLIPGITAVHAEFVSCNPAYFDHWVSNGTKKTCLQQRSVHTLISHYYFSSSNIVVSRTGFIGTLEDVLSFTPKARIHLYCVI